MRQYYSHKTKILSWYVMYQKFLHVILKADFVCLFKQLTQKYKCENCHGPLIKCVRSFLVGEVIRWELGGQLILWKLFLDKFWLRVGLFWSDRIWWFPLTNVTYSYAKSIKFVWQEFTEEQNIVVEPGAEVALMLGQVEACS